MAVACDVRYCSADARFCVKEVDLAITADIGTLQRLPTLVGHGVATEMALTARVVGAEEAKAIGLVTEVAPDAAALEAAVAESAAALAAKSPLAVQGDEAGDASRPGSQRRGWARVRRDDELGEVDVGGPERGDGGEVRQAGADVFQVVKSWCQPRVCLTKVFASITLPPTPCGVRRTFVLCVLSCGRSVSSV